ncbi:MAG: hypothetical protein LBR80_17665 [Deltaproteobacteria bacterium]|nr:hypothetical protein [Deltaproteobacteria bacterium]
MTLSGGCVVRFEDSESSRLRLGGSVALVPGGIANPFVGAAWKLEFDGRARAFVTGSPTDEPSLRGGSA